MSISTIAAAMISVAAAQPQPGAGELPVAERLEQALQQMVPPVVVAGRDYQPRPVTELMQWENVPGVSVAVIDDGRIVWARGFGVADRATGRPVTTETMFQAASVSKPVAASGALVLLEQGLLSLDRPVSEQLTSWQVPAHAFPGEVTLRGLLSHTAGLTVHGFPGYRTDAQLPTVVQVLDGAAPANTAPVRVDIQPGSRWRYSGGGITVAQLLMTDVTREPFPALMDRLVLRPFGMTHSTYEQPPIGTHAGQVATAHGSDGQPVPGGYHLYPEMAAAGLWTTPSDLARWAAAISAAFNGEAGGPIRPATARAMLTPGQGGNLGNWGLGVSLVGDPASEDFRFWHSGVNEGFRAVLWSHPRRRQAVVVMANSDNGNQILGPVRLAVGRVLGWPGSEQRVITPSSVPLAERVDLVGRYSEPRFSIHVGVMESGLVLVPSQGDPAEAVPQADGAYELADGGGRVQFQRDAAGNVTGLTVRGLTLQRTP